MQNFFLRHVALDALGERNHPAEHLPAVFAVRVHAARHVYALDGAALRLSAAVAAEHPAVALFAFVEGNLLFMLFPPRIISGERVGGFAPRLLPFDL